MLDLQTAPDTDLPPTWAEAWETFDLLRRPDLSDRTRANYREALVALARYLGPTPPPLDQLTRYQLAAFLSPGRDGLAAATQANRHRSLSALFGWLARPVAGDDPYLARNPIRGLSVPKADEDPVPVLSLDDVRRLLATCQTASFEDRRDEALLRFLFDTGARRGEVTSMRLDRLDLKGMTAVVSGKTGPRIVAFGPKTASALYRYLRQRQKHPRKAAPQLWLGHQGPLQGNGIYQAIARRFEWAGVNGHKMVHAFRHSFAHYFAADGGNETDLMQLAGWSSLAMARRYGRSAAAERARVAHRQHSPGDLL